MDEKYFNKRRSNQEEKNSGMRLAEPRFTSAFIFIDVFSITTCLLICSNTV